MKYFFAILACGAGFLAYAVVSELLGWKRGGGILPIVILFSVIGWTWRSITKTPAQGPATPTENSPDNPAENEK